MSESDNKYKCEDHKIDLICRGCMQAWIARHDKMLEYVRTDSRRFLNEKELDNLKYNDPFEYAKIMRNRKLLREIGEL